MLVDTRRGLLVTVGLPCESHVIVRLVLVIRSHQEGRQVWAVGGYLIVQKRGWHVSGKVLWVVIVNIHSVSRDLEVPKHALVLHLGHHILRELILTLVVVLGLLLRLLDVLLFDISLEGFPHSHAIGHVGVVLWMRHILTCVLGSESLSVSEEVGGGSALVPEAVRGGLFT